MLFCQGKTATQLIRTPHKYSTQYTTAYFSSKLNAQRPYS